MNSSHHSLDRCEDCGLEMSAGVRVCENLFNEGLALHFTSPAYFGVHRLFVDVYCLQHPGHGCISFKSFAAHAAHLCWSLERGGSRAVPSEPIRRWIERHPHLEKPTLPVRRGTMTIADVVRTSTPSEHHQAVERWAHDVWKAYADLQSTIRRWIDLAYANTGTAPIRTERQKPTRSNLSHECLRRITADAK